MKKFIIVVIILSVSLSILAIDTIAIALKIKGDVDISREDKTFFANTGENLFNHDVLESKQEAFAAIKFIDGSSIVKIFPNSVLTISAEKDGDKLNKKAQLDIGDIWTKVTKKTGDFEIDTPTTVVSVKGTEFFLSIDDDGNTELFTIEGTVHIKNKEDGQEAEVEEGQKAHSTGEGEITVSIIEEGDLDQTQIDELNESSKTLEIEIENEQGDTKTIKIKFE